MRMNEIVWNGENTEEVVRFCVGWDVSLCCIHREFDNLLTGERMLEIEPSDTMRGFTFDIPLNKRIVRMNEGYRRWLVVE